MTEHAPNGGSAAAPDRAAAAKKETPAAKKPESPARTDETTPETVAIESEPAMNVRGIALTIMSVLAVILVLQYAQSVLIPIVLAVLISYVLGPFVDSLARRGLSRWIGAALVIVLLCGTIAYSTYMLAPQFIAFVDEVPNATKRLAARTRVARRTEDASAIEKMQRAASEIDKVAAAASDPAPTQQGVTRVQVVEPAFRATEYLWAGGKTAVAFLGQFAMVLFLVFFLLVTGDLFKRKLVKIAGPTLTKKKITVQIMDDINKQISGFLRVQVFTSALVGVLTALALWYFDVRQFVVWGVFAGTFNSIPYLGPLIVTGGLGAVTFMQFDDLVKTTYICGITMAITSLEGWLLTPALMSRAAQMNPVAIFIGLLFWSWVWGVWGTILAVPMMMTAKAICDRVEDLQPVGELLGE